MTNEQMFEKLMTEIKDIKETQNLMQSQLKETNEIVHAIRDRQEETDAKLDSLSMDINKIHGVVTEHTEIIQKLVKSQERQEKILERLSLRSIEQEQDIAELRRIK
ncbi:hypothetical protein M670_00277 [Schinkia azotoformans MEV2011]|uniref:Uncharacterized protein n=1 Tax=Schinkia azotoformans MEV2011 TaxID=1348973 RepID=A0A072P457_SCHAZ|nr:hypothetical protein [Schinkia azotoformans]KEF40255.1 hypothetical protein M670_00277 [Schinkia azotoformans MEV2011]MEC1696437.1 hypothetical protein [Schinkia azotoformans]MEC1715176.1 hypothetical protein [Schinkia azotoformans]MEC1724108.1 hypothetical protein [Schinkia azotoformans]MEC1739774.1 hypothetical protein [Schinkia azotoformans]